MFESSYQKLASAVKKNSEAGVNLSENERTTLDRMGKYIERLKSDCPDKVLEKYIPGLKGEGYFKVGKTPFETFLK